MGAEPPSIAIPRRSPLPFTGVSKRKRAIFYTQLARMLHAGIGPVRCLTTLAEQGGSRRLARAARDMVAHIQSGGTLAEALAQHPNIFPPNEVRMVEASEHAGAAPETMLRMARFLDTMAAFWRKVATGLMYPCVCLAVALGALPLLLAYFGHFGGVANVLRIQATVVAVGVGSVLLLVIGWRSLGARSRPRVFLHRLLLSLPVYGKLARKLALARFADTFECLYSAGVQATEAMARAAMACGNESIGQQILQVVPLVQEGVPLSAALAQSRAIPVTGLNMFEVGVKVGKLDESLRKFAEYQQTDAEVAIERLARILPTIAIFAMIAVLAYTVLRAWMTYISAIRGMMR